MSRVLELEQLFADTKWPSKQLQSCNDGEPITEYACSHFSQQRNCRLQWHGPSTNSSTVETTFYKSELNILRKCQTSECNSWTIYTKNFTDVSNPDHAVDEEVRFMWTVDRPESCAAAGFTVGLTAIFVWHKQSARTSVHGIRIRGCLSNLLPAVVKSATLPPKSLIDKHISQHFSVEREERRLLSA